MELKKVKIMGITGFILAFSLLVTSSVHADGTAPGEGLYIGGFLGQSSGVVSPKITIIDTDDGFANSAIDNQTFEAKDGGLGLTGIQGGAWFGWGLRTADDIYIGFDGSFAGAGDKIELTSSVDITESHKGGAITKATAERNWVGAGALRVGYYVNPETLFSLSGGVAVSEYDVKVGSDSDTVYAGGPQVGASITTNITKVDPNLSLRIDALYTDFLTAQMNGIQGSNSNDGTAGKNNDSELTGSETSFRVGLTYRFGDLSSLF